VRELDIPCSAHTATREQTSDSQMAKHRPLTNLALSHPLARDSRPLSDRVGGGAWRRSGPAPRASQRRRKASKLAPPRLRLRIGGGQPDPGRVHRQDLSSAISHFSILEKKESAGLNAGNRTGNVSNKDICEITTRCIVALYTNHYTKSAFQTL
jgi:hypothetical protein